MSGDSPNILLNSPEWGVTTTFCPSMIGSISLTRELASKDTRTFRSSNDLTSNFIASISWIASPIPIAAESMSTGICPSILLTVPRVSFESAIGML